MVCEHCGSKWDSTKNVSFCPFCGKSLIADNNLTISDVIRMLINEQGIEILKKNKVLISYIMDYVNNFDREKKLLRIACVNGGLDCAYNIVQCNEQSRVEILIKKQLKVLTDDAFLSFDNACEAFGIILKGIGFNIDDYLISSSNKTKNENASQKAEWKSKTIHDGNDFPAPNIKYDDVIIDFQLVLLNVIEKKRSKLYSSAVSLYNDASKHRDIEIARKSIDVFKSIRIYRDSSIWIDRCEKLIRDIDYSTAIGLTEKMKTTKNIENINQIAKQATMIFRTLGIYKDSAAQIKATEETRKNCIYLIAYDTMKQADNYRDETIYSNAMLKFDGIKDYKDANELSRYCKKQMEVTHLETLYKKAIYLSKKEDQYSLKEAIKMFKELSVSLRDCSKEIAFCQSKLSSVSKKSSEKIITPKTNYSPKVFYNTDVSATWKSKGLCSYCGGEFKKKLFQPYVCKKCGKTKNY